MLYVDLDCNRFSGAPCPPAHFRRRKSRFSGSLPRQPAHFVRLSSWRHQGEVPPVVTYFALIKQNPQFEARAQHAVLMRMMRFSPSSQKIFAMQIFFGSPDELTDCFGCGGVCLSRRPRREAPSDAEGGARALREVGCRGRRSRPRQLCRRLVSRR